MDPSKLCNGTRSQVIAFKNIMETIIFFIFNPITGEYIFINFSSRISIIPPNILFRIKRIQYPIKICFAMTINKTQRQSFKRVGVDLCNNFFSRTQLYVASLCVG